MWLQRFIDWIHYVTGPEVFSHPAPAVIVPDIPATKQFHPVDPTVPLFPGRPLVIDLYHGDNVIDFGAIRASGIVGVIHKASQGSSIDHTYATRRKLAKQAGLLWGAYHFADLTDPATQAEYFLSAADPGDGDLLALDWERINGSSLTADQARVFLETIERKHGRKAVIYSGDVAKERIHDSDAYFGAHRLWLAQYGKAWRVQSSWTKPWLWQNNGDNIGPGPHQIPGVKGLCDNSTIIDATENLVTTWA